MDIFYYLFEGFGSDVPDVTFVWVVKIKNSLLTSNLPNTRRETYESRLDAYLDFDGLKAPSILISPTKGLGQLILTDEQMLRLLASYSKKNLVTLEITQNCTKK